MPNDLTTLLAQFLVDLYAGTVRIGTATLTSPVSNTLAISPDGSERYRFTSSGLLINSTETITWGSPLTSPDVVLGRAAANRLQLATGDVFNLAPTAFASLPTGAEGDVAFVTDSSTATPGATVAGGGANNVQVFFNGTNWICS